MRNKKKKELNTFIILIICLAIVGGAAYGLNFAQNRFEASHAVAESLPPLPENLQQNQISNIINDGYLESGSFMQN